MKNTDGQQYYPCNNRISVYNSSVGTATMPTESVRIDFNSKLGGGSGEFAFGARKSLCGASGGLLQVGCKLVAS